MTSTEEPVSFSPIEVGLLTIAERRGSVRTPKNVDVRNEPTHVERLTVLTRLVERGFMRQLEIDETSTEIAFAMTDEGKKALHTADRPAGLQPSERAPGTGA